MGYSQLFIRGDDASRVAKHRSFNGDINIKEVASATNASFTDTAGNTVDWHIEPAQASTTTVAQGGDNTISFDGEPVAIVGDEDNEAIYIRGSDGNAIEDAAAGAASRVVLGLHGLAN